MRSAIRTAFVLGRVSNLPTVWSNLLAGWLLGGGGLEGLTALFLALAGATLLYVAGMYLNDFFDADFDRQFRPERPIPSGAIGRRVVGMIGLLMLLAGLSAIAPLGVKPLLIAAALAACICLYDAFHKKMPSAPLLMGACRFLLYPLAAAVEFGPLDAVVLLPAGMLALYVTGITFLARGESRPRKSGRWALLLLLAPAAWLMVQGGVGGWGAPLLCLLLFLGWMAWLIVPLWRGAKPSISRAVAGLLAGIVLVDMVAVAPVAGMSSLYFLFLMALAVLAQRFIPAT